ncbi:methyltransferase domain-containing protein [Candidatus Micrarchaeota archaeon]|nr:methyltransferase domain-containing protein [Candidatus Micrarchaeota archaeon]
MDKSMQAVGIYDKIASKYAESFKPKPKEANLVKQFIKLLAKKKRVLDVGCGNCDYFDWFEKSKAKYVGIDLSKEMIKVAKKTHPK